MTRNKSWLTPKEVADLLMVSTAAIRLWAEKGQLKAMVTAGGHRRFKLEDIQQFASERNIKLNIEPPARNKINILIVDDEPMFAEYLKSVITLKTDDVGVHVSIDGFDAGTKLRDINPDIVLLDLKMPGLDGFAVCRQIRRAGQNADVRVIAMTGEKNAENEQRILAAGAEHCLEKPFALNTLLTLLNVPQAA